MFEALLRFLGRTIPAREFEQCVFSAVARKISDQEAVKRELEGAFALAGFSGSDGQRENRAAHFYLALEDHVENGQEVNRMSKAELREHVFTHCHPGRAEGNFRLLFLTRYAREAILYEMYASVLFARVRSLIGDEAFANVLQAIEGLGKGGRIVRNGTIAFDELHRSMHGASAPERAETIRMFLEEAVGALLKALIEAVDTMRAELFLQEVYREFATQLDFLDVAVMLRIVPEGLLSEERLALLEKTELAHELQRKQDELEMSISRFKEEHGRLSTLSREELEKRVTERTAELVKALEEVKASRAQLQEFSSLATHELRTPVGIIKGYASLLLDGSAGKATEQQKKFATQIKGAAERLLELVSAILNASRIELGTLAIDPEPVYLPDLAETMLVELAPHLSNRNLTVTKMFDKKIPIVDADPMLVRAVLQNLLSNAMKYTPDGGAVTVKIEKRGEDAVLEVADTGYGIPKTQQDKVFTKMFRADNIRAKQIEGTGLGLYIVKSVLEQAGGSISFSSEEGKGSTFSVSIPLSGMKKKEGIRGLS